MRRVFNLKSHSRSWLASRWLGPILVAASLCGASTAAAGGLSFTDQPAPKNVTLLGIESATVAPHGMIFGALSGTTRRSSTVDKSDGSFQLGVGLGNAERGIGVRIGAVTTPLSNGFGDTGYFTVKLSRRIVAGRMPTYLGLSVGRLARWGNTAGVDTGATLVVTSFSQVRFAPGGESYPVMFSLGGGTNIRKNSTHPGAFAGVGIGLSRNVGASLSWSGDYFDLGTAFRFDGLPNLGFTVEVDDVFDQRSSRRLTGALVWYLPKAFGG